MATLIKKVIIQIYATLKFLLIHLKHQYNYYFFKFQNKIHLEHQYYYYFFKFQNSYGLCSKWTSKYRLTNSLFLQ